MVGTRSDLPRSASPNHQSFFPCLEKDKFRWCLDCQVLNSLIKKHGVRYEAVEEVRTFLCKGDFCTSVDVKGAFLHIPIHPNSRYLLQFSANGTIYQFNTLPFGVSSAPFFWTKIFGVLIRRIRSLGIRVSVYMDDLLSASSDFETCLKHTALVISILEEAGITINFEKSVLSPSQKIVHIGFLWNTRSNVILLRRSKINDISKAARHLLNLPSPTSRDLARMSGKLISTSPALLPAIYKRRPLTRDIKITNQNWDQPVTLSHASIKALKFFSSPHLISKFNGRPLVQANPFWILTSDASPSGWGATLEAPHASPPIHLTTKGSFSSSELLQSSNFKETLALTLATLSFKDVIINSQNLSILFRSDNTTAVSYLRKMGGPIAHLEEAISPLIKWIIRHRIHYQVSHIPGRENEKADSLSRSKRRDHDYILSRHQFTYLESQWGPHSIDLFASRINKQATRFAS